jgi:predicted alpha/beta hydrolase
LNTEANIEVSDLLISSGGGRQLAASCIYPVANTDGGDWVVIAAAMAVRRRFYHSLAGFLAGRGYKVIVFDYWGIGDSAATHPRDCDTSLSEWGQLDIKAVLQWTRGQGEARKVFLIGHSLGAQLPGIAPSVVYIDGLVLVGASGWDWRHWPGIDRFRTFFVFYLAIPLLTRLFGYFPGRFLGDGQNVPPRVALEWARWGRHPDCLRRPDQEPRPLFFGQIVAPLLCWHIEDDPLTPMSAVSALLGWYRSANIEIRSTAGADGDSLPIGHWGWFREHKCRLFWAETADWIDAQARKT